MTNHVHLLLKPGDDGAVSRMMQRLGSTYTAVINATYQRSGSLWEGRFKSSLVDSEDYVLASYRYIELNPVRARMVAHPSAYRWSSCRHNAIRLDDYPIRPHAHGLTLGSDTPTRRARYRSLVEEGIDGETLIEIRYATCKGLPTGSGRFKQEIEAALARRIGNGHRGRPKKALTPYFASRSADETDRSSSLHQPENACQRTWDHCH